MGVCPSWYCTTSRSWLWHVAKLRSDRDGDGLSFERESALGTDPNRADSDGDGVADGEEEVAKGYNPFVRIPIKGRPERRPGSELWVQSAGGGYGR